MRQTQLFDRASPGPGASGNFRAAFAASLVGGLLLLGAAAPSRAELAAPSSEGWLVKSYGEVAAPRMEKNARAELTALKAIVAKRTADDIVRFRWWAAGGPAYRWNEILLAEMQDAFVTLPLAARHLALFQVAIDDAVAAAWRNKTGTRGDAAVVDAALGAPNDALHPSAYAAAAAAASQVLAYLFPARAEKFAALAEQAMQSRLLGGAEFPQEVAAGRAIGNDVAELAIARGRADRSADKWSGTIPQGAGSWKGVNPIAPAAANWQTWVLTHPAEFRPAPPPAFDSEATKAALQELKTFPRAPKTNHRAVFWEVNGGARAHALWNEIARAKLLEYGVPPRESARVLAALNVAFADAGVACWDAKYAFWYIRPPQLDPELKSLFPPPNHPSYPAAHGCFSSAAATVLAALFPHDREPLVAFGKEASEARIWAGIHYRFDVDAGAEIGRKVAERTLARAFKARTN